jgi:hypothetical protein
MKNNRTPLDSFEYAIYKNKGIYKKIATLNRDLFVLTKDFTIMDWRKIKTPVAQKHIDEIFFSKHLEDNQKEYLYKKYLLTIVKEYLNEDVEIF